MRVNGTACPGGICFNGKCKQATVCVGACCTDENIAYIDGYPCPGGQCIDGRCRALPECIGECCDNGKPKADGTACAECNCMSGMCTNLNKRCATGHCCDTYKKILRPKGFPCTNNPCAAKVECSGISEFCPEPTQYKVDGTPCPTGICMAGVCINEPFNATKFAEQKAKDEKEKENTEKKKNEKVIIAGNLEIHHHYVAAPVCKSGACCNLEESEVYPKGHSCSNRTCYVGVCDGKTSGCSYTPAPAGTPCEDGNCFDGVCVKNCIGMCCQADEVTPKEDGSLCPDGFCFRGACIKKCEGECCEDLPLFSDNREENIKNKQFGIKRHFGTPIQQAKMDGSPCKNNNGYCMKGVCHDFTVPAFTPKDNSRPGVIPDPSDVKLFIDTFKQRFVKNFFQAAAAVENDQMDEEDRAYLKAKLDKAKAENKERREKALNAAANEQATLVAAANLQSGNRSWVDKVFNRANFAYLCMFIIVVVVIACIVKIVSSRRNNKKTKYVTPGKKNSHAAPADENYDF